MKRQGYEVLQASDGLEALDIMEEEDYKVDLVVSDVKMPEMSGLEICRRLKQDERGRELTRVIEAEIDRLQRSVMQVLTYSRPQATEHVAH